MWSQGLTRGDAEAGEYVESIVWKALCKALKDHQWGKQQTRPPTYVWLLSWATLWSVCR